MDTITYQMLVTNVNVRFSGSIICETYGQFFFLQLFGILQELKIVGKF